MNRIQRGTSKLSRTKPSLRLLALTSAFLLPLAHTSTAKAADQALDKWKRSLFKEATALGISQKTLVNGIAKTRPNYKLPACAPTVIGHALQLQIKNANRPPLPNSRQKTACQPPATVRARASFYFPLSIFRQGI